MGRVLSQKIRFDRKQDASMKLRQFSHDNPPHAGMRRLGWVSMATFTVKGRLTSALITLALPGATE